MKKSKLLPVIGIALFLYIISKVNVGRVVEGFSRIDPLWFAATIAIFCATHAIKGARWKILIDCYGKKYPLLSSIKGWLIGYSLSLITPGKVGDFARAYYLKDHMGTGKSLTTVMVDRVIDIFVLFILAIIGISTFVTMYVKNDFLLFGTYALFAAFVACIVIFSKQGIATPILRPFYRRLAPKKYRKRAKRVYFDFYAGLDVLFKKKRVIVVTTAITVVFWLLSILATYTLAVSLSLGVSYLFLLMAMPIVLIVLALPISFSGIGTRDATLIFFFSYIGLVAEQTLSYTIMLLVVDYIFAIPGFILFFKNPIKLDKD